MGNETERNKQQNPGQEKGKQGNVAEPTRKDPSQSSDVRNQQDPTKKNPGQSGDIMGRKDREDPKKLKSVAHPNPANTRVSRKRRPRRTVVAFVRFANLFQITLPRAGTTDPSRPNQGRARFAMLYFFILFDVLVAGGPYR